MHGAKWKKYLGTWRLTSCFRAEGENKDPTFSRISMKWWKIEGPKALTITVIVPCSSTKCESPTLKDEVSENGWCWIPAGWHLEQHYCAGSLSALLVLALWNRVWEIAGSRREKRWHVDFLAFSCVSSVFSYIQRPYLTRMSWTPHWTNERPPFFFFLQHCPCDFSYSISNYNTENWAEELEQRPQAKFILHHNARKAWKYPQKICIEELKIWIVHDALAISHTRLQSTILKPEMRREIQI